MRTFGLSTPMPNALVAHDHPHLVGQEPALHVGALLARQPGVVGDGLLPELRRELSAISSAPARVPA